jgi:DNA-directed RNA polymerase subunit M/transcription elongation factor TFIIS
MGDREYFINLIVDNVNELFNLTFTNDKEIIRNNRPDVVMEIINMLFREINELEENSEVTIYGINGKYIKNDSQEYDGKLDLKYTKKQNDTAKFFESIIIMVVNRLNNITINNKPILKNNKKQLETVINERFNEVTDFLESVSTYDDIIWQQQLFDSVRAEIKEDIKRSQYKPSGIKGMGVCRRCGSEELYVLSKQTRSGDEGMATKYTCVSCSFQWTIK